MEKKLLIRHIRLVLLAVFYSLKTYPNLIGREFDIYGKTQSLRFLLQNRRKDFIPLFCNPVSIVRYFEFPFVFENVKWRQCRQWLDVSSPRLFCLYAAKKNPHIHLESVNPDMADSDKTCSWFKYLKIKNSARFCCHDAKDLPYPDASFDVVTSISVVEHIPEPFDKKAVQEMWRVLKPGGKLLLTVPCCKLHEDEWRDTDVYGLNSSKNEDKYFFQRYYDAVSLESRLLDPIKAKPKKLKIFGEIKQGQFKRYERRWKKYGLQETVKDPLYISLYYKYFNHFEQLPGMGVCGLVLDKENK